MPKAININDKFGFWTVIDTAPNQVSPDGTSRKRFLCQCDCGTLRPVTATQLRTGKSTSCGCKGSYLKPEETYQEWTVLYKSDKRNNHGNQFYMCRCSCGVVRNVRMADLLNGSSKNCGHTRQTLSLGAQAIKDFLINNGYNFYQEYIFPDMSNRRYDFAIFDKDNPNIITRLIEFDGEQHCENSRSNWHSDDLVKRDKEKNAYALKRNIPLIRIPYYKTTINEKDIFGEKFLVEEE